MAKDFSLADLDKNRVGTFTKDHGDAVCPIVLEIDGVETKTFGNGADAESKPHIIFKDYPKTLPLTITRQIQLKDIFSAKTMLKGQKVKLVIAEADCGKMGKKMSVCVVAADED